MGSFYCNVTLLGATLKAVREVSPRPALLVADGGDVVVFAEADDGSAPQSGAELSAVLGCVAVSVGVHDDDILFFEVHDRGESVIRGAVPDPTSYFSIDAEGLGDLERSMIEGLEAPGTADSNGAPDASAIVAMIGRGDIELAREALEDDFVFASERHAALASALGLPRAAVGWGYRYLSTDDTRYSGPPLVEV